MSDPHDDAHRNDEPRPDESQHDEPQPDEPQPPDPPELKLERDPDSGNPPGPADPPRSGEPPAGEQPSQAGPPPEPEPPSQPVPAPQPELQQEPTEQPSFARAPGDEPPTTGAAGPPASRRSVLARIVGVCAALPFVGGAVVALRSGLSPAPEEIPERVPLGKLREVPEQGLLRRAVTFPVRRGPRVEPVTEVVFLTRHEGRVIAFSARCTHQGCPVVTDKQVGENAASSGPPLVCPCHGGAYTATGEPAGGPVKERLPRLRLDLPDTPEGTIHWVRVHG